MSETDVEYKVYRPIISKLADDVCQSISRSVIRALQAMKPSFALGDSLDVKNVWEELCVLMNEGDSDSPIWDAYMFTVDQAVTGVLLDKKLSDWQLCAIWIETQPGIDWIRELEGDDDGSSFDGLTWCEEDVVEYIRREYVCRVAMDWSNQRLRHYFDSRFQPDEPW